MSAEGQSPDKVAIGISFGNSYSSIAATVSGDALVIANEEGDRQIPTALSYVEGEEFHGTQAKSQLIRNPKNTVAYFRDFLGKEYVDPVERTRAWLTDMQLRVDRSYTVQSIRSPSEARLYNRFLNQGHRRRNTKHSHSL